MRSETVLIVGKGPSAPAAARRVLDREDCDVCVINDAGNLLRPTDRIDWCVWTDWGLLGKCEPFQERVGCFISPVEPEESPAWYDAGRHVFHGTLHCPGSEQDFLEMIGSGGICHHHTTAGGVHWLTKHAKYRRFIMTGIDGGPSHSVAAGVTPGSTVEYVLEQEGENFRDNWKAILERLCDLLARVYAVEFIWEK